MKVALDLESVLANTHQRLLDVYNERHDTKYKPEDATYWGWVNDELEDWFDIMQKEWEYDWHKIEPEVNMDEVSKLLSDTDHTVDLVTGRFGVEEEMKKWLKMYGVYENLDSFVSIDPREESKLDLDYDIYIDDKGKMIEKSNKQGIVEDRLPRDKFLYLVKQPWNRYYWYCDKEYENVELVESAIEGLEKVISEWD